jgi:hypothetical protein
MIDKGHLPIVECTHHNRVVTRRSVFECLKAPSAGRGHKKATNVNRVATG